MQLAKLPGYLKKAYRDSNVTRRVEHFNGWIDRATPDRVDGAAYDHAKQ